MKKRALIVLPVSAKPLKKAARLFNLFSSFPDWEVKYLTPQDRHIHPKSVVILPDTGGIYPFVSYFEAQAAGVPLQDYAIEAFRLSNLHYYVQKNVGIFGLGSCAYLTFAEVCKGTLSITPGNGKLAYTGDMHTKAFFEGETFYCKTSGKLCAGMGEYVIDEDLVAFVEDVFFPPAETVAVTVERPSPGSPPSPNRIDI